MKDFLKMLTDWLPIISVVISACLSYFVAALKAHSEIKKIKLTLNHDNMNVLNSAFATLMEKTLFYCSAQNEKLRSEAINANAEYMCLTSESVRPTLQKLDAAIFDKNFDEIKKLRTEIFMLHSQHCRKPHKYSDNK